MCLIWTDLSRTIINSLPILVISWIFRGHIANNLIHISNVNLHSKDMKIVYTGRDTAGLKKLVNFFQIIIRAGLLESRLTLTQG